MHEKSETCHLYVHLNDDFKDALIVYIYYVQSYFMAGSFSYQFTSPGIHYYSSGYVDEAHSIFLQGVINVLPADTRHIPLHLSVGGTEATYAQGKRIRDGNTFFCSLQCLLPFWSKRQMTGSNPACLIIHMTLSRSGHPRGWSMKHRPC